MNSSLASVAAASVATVVQALVLGFFVVTSLNDVAVDVEVTNDAAVVDVGLQSLVVKRISGGGVQVAMSVGMGMALLGLTKTLNWDAAFGASRRKPRSKES